MRYGKYTFTILILAMAALVCLPARAELQNTFSLSLSSLKPGESDTFSASAGSDSGSGTVINSAGGVWQLTLNPAGAAGRYSTVTGSGAVSRPGIGADTFMFFRSLLSASFISAASSATNTCPSSAVTYNWLGFRLRPSDVSALPMDAASPGYYVGGTLTYDTLATHHLSGTSYFDLAGPTVSTNSVYYDPIASSTCSDMSVRLGAGSAVKPLDPYGTLLFGTTNFVWMGSSGNPLVAFGTPRVTLSSLSGVSAYTFTGLYTEFTSRTAQVRKNIYMVPDGSGTTYTLREATDLNDPTVYSTLGSLTCTTLNSPSLGFCSGTLTLNGVSGSGKAVCLPYLTSASNGNQNVMACAAQRPGTNWVYATILAQTPPATRIAITPAVSAASNINETGTGVYTVRNLSGRVVPSFGTPTFGSNGSTSTANFSVTANTCNTALAGYGTCSVTVAFTSATYQTLTDTFRLPYSDGTGATPNATAVSIGTAGLTSIAITPASGTYLSNATDTLTATATYANASTQNVSAVASWASSNTAVASISSTGGLTVASNANGTSSISATLGAISGSTTITGYTPPPEPTGFSGSASALVVTLNWTSGGGTTSGFKLAYTTGGTAPANCNTGTTSTLGNVATTNLTLNPGVQYSFRLCSSDAGAHLSSGVTTSVTVSGHMVFVSSSTYTGNLGGLSGADAKCQTLANAQSLGGQFKAVLTDAILNSPQHVEISGPVYNMRPSGSGGKQQVSANSAAFFSGNRSQSMAYTESGATTTNGVWTNMYDTGAPAQTVAASTCSGFSSTSGNVFTGLSTQTSSGYWTYYTATACSSSLSIYCLGGQTYRPNPPGSLTVSPVTNSGMSIGWTLYSNNGDAYDDTGIRVYRSTDNVTYSLIATTAAHATSYSDSGLSAGTLYYYKVAAINTVGGTTYESQLTSAGSATAVAVIHRMFVTSTTYNGNLGGLHGADAKCQARADARSLGGTWKASLANAVITPLNHTQILGPVYNLRPSGSGGAQLVASNSAGFYSSNHSNAINYDETGTISTNNVWTNYYSTGAIVGATYECSNYSSTTGTVYAGNAQYYSSGYWTYVTTNSCATAISLYCIDGQTPRPNPATALVAAPLTGSGVRLNWTINSNNGDSFDDTGVRIYRSTDNVSYSLVTTLAAHTATYDDTGLSSNTTYYYKVATINTVSGTTYESDLTSAVSQLTYAVLHRVFLTSTTYTGNLGGLAGADSKCASEASGAGLGGTWKAILSSTTVNASSRITISGPVYNTRSSGAGGAQQVASNSANFWSATHTATMEYSQTGTQPGTYAWMNTYSTGALVQSSGVCSDWSSTSGAVYNGWPTQTSSGYFAYAVASNCNTNQSIYCIDGQ